MASREVSPPAKDMAIFDMSKNIEPWSPFERVLDDLKQDQLWPGNKPTDEPESCPRCGYPETRHKPEREFFWVKA